jgi:hypothetical protein
MALCTGAEWAPESTCFSRPLVQIVQAILRRTVRDFAQTPPTAMGRAKDSASREAKEEQQRTQRHRTPCCKGVCRTLLKITTGLVASRPLRRRLRRWWCRCFFPLCHSKSLNGPSGMSRHNLYKVAMQMVFDHTRRTTQQSFKANSRGCIFFKNPQEKLMRMILYRRRFG